ncbi:hypothetical protein SUGI_0750170 [Cryptomeria japonica]|nr:hypothetical protein SUGI_0750170 [Cryptomeria japonica]
MASNDSLTLPGLNAGSPALLGLNTPVSIVEVAAPVRPTPAAALAPLVEGGLGALPPWVTYLGIDYGGNRLALADPMPVLSPLHVGSKPHVTLPQNNRHLSQDCQTILIFFYLSCF